MKILNKCFIFDFGLFEPQYMSVIRDGYHKIINLSTESKKEIRNMKITKDGKRLCVYSLLDNKVYRYDKRLKGIKKLIKAGMLN